MRRVNARMGSATKMPEKRWRETLRLLLFRISTTKHGMYLTGGFNVKYLRYG